MRTSRALLTLALGISGALAAPRGATASSGMGAYGVIDRVIWEPGPGPAGAQRVQLHGAFALRNEWGRDNPYGVPTCGYLYYYCPDGHTALCQLQWADFARAAGTSKCVAFGGRPFDQQGSIRLPGQPATRPDPFPIHLGVVGDVSYESCPDVKVKFATCPASGGGGPPDGGMTTTPPPPPPSPPPPSPPPPSPPPPPPASPPPPPPSTAADAAPPETNPLPGKRPGCTFGSGDPAATPPSLVALLLLASRARSRWRRRR